MNKLYLFLLFICFSASLSAQEIQYTINVNTPKLQTADPATIETFKKTIIDFLNNQAWTDESVKDEEKIKVNLQITISNDPSPTQFEASLAILATRPVYGSTYESVIFQYVDDKVNFNFEPGNSYTFNINTYSDNLTSILSYYSYLILGLDKDSFADHGGDAMFEKAQQVVNVLPTGISQGATAGWDVNSASRNNQTRYYLIENLNNKKLSAFRTGFYEYHLHGLDLFSSDILGARKNMINALKSWEKSYDSYNTALIISLMANIKTDELVDIFKPAEKTEKEEVARILSKLNPSGRQKLIDLQR